VQDAATNGHAPSTQPEMPSTAEIDGNMSGDEKEGGVPALKTDGRPPAPPKKFIWTAEMRALLAELVENMGDIVDLNLKAESA
jgi:hypothetical protein